MRSQSISALLKTVMQSGSEVVDIGAGNCKIAKEFSEIADVTPVDIRDYNRTDLKLVLYDGSRLPFKDNAFDDSLLVFVLHHSADYMNLLHEAKRISRNRIIVVEDTPKNIIERFFWRVFDWILNAPHDLRPAMAAKTQDEWEEIFEQQGLKLLGKQNFRTSFPVFSTYQHTLFVLGKLR